MLPSTINLQQLAVVDVLSSDGLGLNPVAFVVAGELEVLSESPRKALTGSTDSVRAGAGRSDGNDVLTVELGDMSRTTFAGL